MTTKNEANKERRARYIAAGNCGICGKPRESPTRGGATNTRCKSCSDKTRASERKNDRKRIADGKCPECGKPHARPKPGRTKGALCADCARRQRVYAAANEKFDGSRAMTARVAIRQAVNPPFVAKTGGVRVPGGRRRDPWDYD